MKERSKVWKLAGPLRFLIVTMVGLYCCFFVFVWGAAFFGHTHGVFELVNVDTNSLSCEPIATIENHPSLKFWQMSFGILCAFIAIIAMVTMAVAANKLLKQLYKYGFFKSGIAKGLKQLGFGLILFWVALLLNENFLPWALTANLNEDHRREMILFIIDPNLFALLAGFLFILLSDAIDQARQMDAENKQII